MRGRQWLIIGGLVTVVFGTQACGSETESQADTLLMDTVEEVTGLDTFQPPMDSGSVGDADNQDSVPSPADTTMPSDVSWADDTVSSSDSSSTKDTAVDAAGGLTPLSGGILLGDLDSELLDTAFATARLTDFVPVAEIPPEYFPCMVSDSDPDAVTPIEKGYDAGVITVSGTNPAVTFTPVDEGADGIGYAASISDDLEDLLPQGGALISVSAEGGVDIGAFSGVIQTPEPVTLSKPSTGFGANLKTSSPALVSWNAGTGEIVLVTLTPLSGLFQPISGKSLLCSLTADTGSFEIPAKVLDLVRNGSGSQNVAIGVTRIRTGTAKNEKYSIPLTASRSTGGVLALVP